MNFGDMDFGALNRMMNMLSDDEREKLAEMAKDMVGKYQAEAEAESVPFEQAYGIEEDLDDLSPAAVDALEQAWDAESFYDGEAADYSGAVLFLAKALLHQLRRRDGSTTSRLQDYLGQGMDEIIQPVLIALFRAESDVYGLEELQALKALLFEKRGLFV